MCGAQLIHHIHIYLYYILFDIFDYEKFRCRKIDTMHKLLLFIRFEPIKTKQNKQTKTIRENINSEKLRLHNNNGQ